MKKNAFKTSPIFKHLNSFFLICLVKLVIQRNKKIKPKYLKPFCLNHK